MTIGFSESHSEMCVDGKLEVEVIVTWPGERYPTTIRISLNAGARIADMKRLIVRACGTCKHFGWLHPELMKVREGGDVPIVGDGNVREYLTPGVVNKFKATVQCNSCYRT